MSNIPANRFHAFKVSVDGNQQKWGYVENLTVEQARDIDRFPLGLQTDIDGTKFTWGYALMFKYC